MGMGANALWRASGEAQQPLQGQYIGASGEAQQATYVPYATLYCTHAGNCRCLSVTEIDLNDPIVSE